MKQQAASKLATYRKLKGLTQEELAEQSGITARTIQRIESGQVLPQVYTLRTLAGCLDTEPENLTEQHMEINISVESKVKLHIGLIAAIHITPLIGIYLPFINVVIPVVFWMLKKEDDPAYDEHGRKIINFQLTISLLTAISIVAMLFIPFGYAMVMTCYAYDIALACINAAKALRGKKAAYPLSIPFLKLRKPKDF